MAIELWVDGREYQASSTRTLPVEDPATGGAAARRAPPPVPARPRAAPPA